ncbi:hypothetical protein AJ80_08627 [Polytolypa hystricis UAMH7299]|uniref:Thioesterase domain-containing protein n=1 Tax=Polytolypa hystricis (strain UAMH7299) TaxID=1447883 RepID=A0A2B7WWP6_POLH7|nr:hypothetical protein AJ80_08627 [Polytolypa hystricis UAMH7299]
MLRPQLLLRAFRPRPAQQSEAIPTSSLHTPSRLPHRSFAHSAQQVHYSNGAHHQGRRWPRHLRSLFYAISFFSLGYWTTNRMFDSFIGHIPDPGTPEDERKLSELRTRFEKLAIVKKLRKDPEFVEWEAYTNFSEEEKAGRLTSGLLKGSRALAIQRIFWNETEKKAVTVVYFGEGLNGWPSVVHGGALGIVLDESLGRVALRSFAAQTGVTANLNLHYRKPVNSGQFCTVTAQYDAERSTERKAVVNGEVKDSMGRVCTEATALFVVPKRLALRKLGDGF